MPQLASNIEINRYLESKGYDIFPFKIDKGMFKISLWRHDEFVDFGRFEYTTWQEAQEKTSRDIYNKLTQ